MIISKYLRKRTHKFMDHQQLLNTIPNNICWWIDFFFVHLSLSGRRGKWTCTNTVVCTYSQTFIHVHAYRAAHGNSCTGRVQFAQAPNPHSSGGRNFPLVRHLMNAGITSAQDYEDTVVEGRLIIIKLNLHFLAITQKRGATTWMCSPTYYLCL